MKITFLTVLLLLSMNVMAVTYEATFPRSTVLVELDDEYGPTKIVVNEPIWGILESEREFRVFMDFHANFYATNGEYIIRMNARERKITIAIASSLSREDYLDLGKAIEGVLKKMD